MPSNLAITSISLGRASAGHSLVTKLDHLHAQGYRGIELFHEDLVSLAREFYTPSSSSFTPRPEDELRAAHLLSKLCSERKIKILCLQPFWHYEGLRDREGAHRAQLTKLEWWFHLAHALGTDLIQIPSNFLPEEDLLPIGDNGEEGEGGRKGWETTIKDLQLVADMGMQEHPRINFVYEALCWGTRVDTWEKSWEVVKAVDRDNFGVCLDTFNIAGRVYADPSRPGGVAEGGREKLSRSLERMVREVDVRKVFYVQVVDAERLEEPMRRGHEWWVEGQPERMSWSRNCRLFYGEGEEDGGKGYLPVREVARAIFEGLGFEGWVSMELFHRRMNDSGDEVPAELAGRGRRSWDRLVGDMGLSVDEGYGLGVVEKKKKEQPRAKPMAMGKMREDFRGRIAARF